MASSTTNHAGHQRRSGCSHVASRLRDRLLAWQRDESGKVSLLASIMLLALVSLAGLIGNAGHIAAQKLETQNAADAIASSSALWMARGMNALTATNHMLGEATAIAAVHEAFGGPESDLGISRDTTENQTLNRLIRTFAPTAPVGTPVPSPFGFTPPPIPAIDKRIVDFVTRRTSPASDKMSAFASIYDARMTLKRELALVLPIKAFADVGFFVPPPWGFGTAAVAWGVHIAGTTNIVLIGKEWVVLDALEAIARLFSPMKRAIEKQLIPTLSAHADFVAGYEPGSRQTKAGILNSAVERAVGELETRLDVDAALFPRFADLRLPVVPEPAPSLAGSTQPADGAATNRLCFRR